MSEGTGDNLLSLSISTLAYMGDAVYEVAVRERLLKAHMDFNSRSLYIEALHYVSAESQAYALKEIYCLLSEEEQSLCRRARNHTPKSRPRHASPLGYRQATALEALIGWHYLRADQERLHTILAAVFAALEKEKVEGSEDV